MTSTGAKTFCKSAKLEICALADGSRKRTVDDIGGVELLLDQARAEIEIDGLLLVSHDAVVDRRNTDFRPAQPVQRHRGRNAHQPAPCLGISARSEERRV